MKKVVFVPGFTGGLHDIVMFKLLVRDVEWIFFRYKTGLKQTIEEIAQQLDDFIKNIELEEGEKICLVGKSAGGDIIDYYLKFIDGSKAERFASICSPFKGSYWTYFFGKKRKGLKQLAPNTSFLEHLGSKKLKGIERLSIWCYFDILVPGKSAKGVNPVHSWFFFHPLMGWWPPTVEKVARFLRK